MLSKFAALVAAFAFLDHTFFRDGVVLFVGSLPELLKQEERNMLSNLGSPTVIWMSLISIVTALLLAKRILKWTDSFESTSLADANLQTIVWTSRIQEAKNFYRDILGLSMLSISDGALVFAVGKGVLRVSPVPSTEPTEHTVLGFEVEDVNVLIEELVERGVDFVRFEGFPHDDNGAVTTPDGARVAWFRDPDGNLLSVVQFSTEI